MSNQAEIDYEKQFQDDLAKATALSLEEQKLDEYRRIKKYGNVTASCERSNSYSSSSPQEYYAQLRARHLARESSTESTKRQTPPPLFSHRRYSEVSHNATTTNTLSNAASNYNVERSRTPPPTTTKTADNDLISWAGSPTSTSNNSSSKSGTSSGDHATFEKLIEDLQKIPTNPQTALVPLGPTAAGAAAAAVNPMPYGGGVATYGMPQPQYVGAAAAGMQMVPYQPSLQQQKIPLTNEELEKLYNMPLQQQRGGMIAYPHPHMPHSAAVMPGYYAMPYSAPIVPGSAAYMPPQYPPHTYGFQYTHAATYQPATNYAPAATAAAGAAIQQQQQQLQQRPHSSPVTYASNNAQHSNHSINQTIATNSSAAASAVANGSSISAMNTTRRQTPPTSRLQQMQTQRTGNDLIDLNQEDDSRVSVLEAFDPLLNDDGNDDASDCTSYYAEYDPFDYLYSSHSSTQYSDPVYEAVNKLDKKAAAVSSNVSAIGWRQEYATNATIYAAENYPSSSAAAAVRRSTSLESTPHTPRSPPPPLPPRNAHANATSETTTITNFYADYLARTTASKERDDASVYSSNNSVYANSYNASIPAHVVLDRRKTCTRLYELVTDQRTVDTELLEFYYMVKDLRARYLFNDEITNAGHVIASEFNYHYMLDTSIKIVVHPALKTLLPHVVASMAAGEQVKGYGTPVVFTCDINSVVDMVIGQALCSLEGKVNGTVNDYVVKPIGVAEWLAPTSKLSQLECVHNSLKLEKDVHLGLCLKTEGNMKVIARTEIDDARDAELRPEDVLPNEMATTITYDNMMILIETLETEIDKLESAFSDTHTRGIISCSGVVQGVKAICALLGSIDTLDIAACVTDLKRICDEAQTKYTGGTGLSAGAAAANPEIVNDYGGDYAEVTLRPRSTLEQIKIKCNQLRDTVQELIELYANVFRVGFSVKTVDYATTPIPISCVLKSIVVNISCLHRPPPNWKYDDYSLGVHINYGSRLISPPIATKCSNDTSGGLFPRLNFSSWITFEKNPICTLPREARLIFVLYGTQAAENEPNNDTNGERRQVTTELGWCSIQLFDYKREMICGPYLLSVWPPTTDKFLGPAPARGCHPQPDICPVLSIEVPQYGGRIQFPEPQEQPAPAPRYDFYSLDTNLQQELLDTAEQGYQGALDKREVFWEKRLYLQSFPNALPKVLHTAHSWDYASLMDLHSLLQSWAPLAPLQALELLLPRYPDAKVREKAVEWISYMPNDQLVDYLPQLLQSLKHDTYEASAMARFLLCKCLESPRIAHHMYWLLVHSLPGDDPQNSIDDTSQIAELAESEITQARYYRRNKMMLRALLAVCGEKLLARFLRQNMMCKNLAQIAESVKESKESMRQKALCSGMDIVHAELFDKPTSLPLGPELEVTGVSVRNCSYFNSNTLPLKVTYIGPDAELMPAIFKSGDDLQQDMLTIQLIRVMNKMWLAENCDLKIVTFNCVPTGYKKGMIELVSDAETLRKIQVEYGLTGSFKDRPIAEWLAKQNPSQLEYQRAVKNFTVSCAGYSVATYILGICDRHNDNIMLKTSGHLFHIDFGKFLGDAQMFGNFKRDRTPFVLTSDMAYVINGGDKPSTEFHYFVDLCCRAFNIVRKHGDLLLHMLALMATAGIPGVTSDAVAYVRDALLPSQSNPEAAASFAKMIQFSLKSWFTQFNFFLHNLAQMRFSNDEGSGELLSFVPRKYTMQQDGRLKSVMVVRCQKHYDMEKYYTYILRVTRHGQTDPTHLFRSYKEFTEFHQKLCLHFPLVKLHSLPSGVHVGRSNVKSVAERRLREIQQFLLSLFNAADEIAHSDLVYTFFHPLLRDQQEAQLNVSKVKELKTQNTRDNSNNVGQIKLSLQYQRGVLTVMIHHAKGLPMLSGNQEPNTYVKCYLKPDTTKATKRKTKVVRKTCVPSFMETLEYRMPLETIRERLLHVTVWSHDTLQENELLGGFQIDLSKYDLRKELIDWFRLGPMSRN